MKLAILGTDSDILSLAAPARDEQHAIVWLGDVRPEDAPAIRQFTTDMADRASEWELLLAHGVVDAVLVGMGMASSELRAERIKRLAAEAIPLLIVHPAFDSVLPYYEVDMIRRETGAIVQHFNRLIGHPVLLQLAEWLADGHRSLGQIHQLTCERRVVAAAREEVLAYFARDAELLAAVAGDIRRVTAIGPTGNTTSFASLQVQMTAAPASSLRWSVGYAATGDVGLELTLLGENGTAALHILDEAAGRNPTWQLEITEQRARHKQPLDSFDPARAAILRLAGAAEESNYERRAAASTWEAATRAMEVVDAAELSLQKGRTIEVYQQHLSERLAFRGTMAAIGCGLLLVVSLALVVVALLGGAEGVVRQRLAPAWPLVLLAVLAFFLALQAVPFLAQKSKRAPPVTQASTPPERET